jgi:hypothetical protein
MNRSVRRIETSSRDFTKLLDARFLALGFSKVTSGVYLRKLGNDWRGNLIVTDAGVSLTPTIGVFSTIVRDAVFNAARAVYTEPYERIRKFSFGPPNFLAPLHSLCERSELFKHRISWRSLTGKSIEQVVDDIFLCVEGVGLPFMAANTNYPALLATAMEFGALHHAQQFSTPAIMMMLGKTEELRDYVAQCMAQYDPKLTDLGDRYMSYLRALEEYLGGRGLLPN